MKVTDKDIDFANLIGIDISLFSKVVAVAALEDHIRKKILGEEFLPASEAQHDFASKLGIDITAHSRNMASAKISEKLDENNEESIRSQNLKKGDLVRKIYGDTGKTYEISSIQSDGVVWFKGGQGQKAWASNVKKVSAAQECFKAG
ncbi:hypothetical protein KW526_09280 [Vibrio fluvialis]|nr:hypothetical protein [Vibrio fluvialis]